MTEKKEETVTISLEEYTRLQRREAFLDCLEACGVDNWSGHGDAHEMMENDEE